LRYLRIWLWRNSRRWSGICGRSRIKRLRAGLLTWLRLSRCWRIGIKRLTGLGTRQRRKIAALDRLCG
jgi:hypothetical protein